VLIPSIYTFSPLIQTLRLIRVLIDQSIRQRLPFIFFTKDKNSLSFSPISFPIQKDDHHDAVYMRQNDDSTGEYRGLSIVYLFDYFVIFYVILYIVMF
jgi:hypothetical protein